MKQILQEIRPKCFTLIYRAKQEVKFAFCMYIIHFYIPDLAMCMYIVWSVFRKLKLIKNYDSKSLGQLNNLTGL